MPVLACGLAGAMGAGSALAKRAQSTVTIAPYEAGVVGEVCSPAASRGEVGRRVKL